MQFQLGIHQPADAAKINDPKCQIMISVRRLRNRKKKVDAPGYWAMDSGGFTEIRNHGEYTISEDEYLDIIWRHEPDWAYCQDWMCEPEMLEKTGLTIEEHQRRTVESFISLSDKHRDRQIALSHRNMARRKAGLPIEEFQCTTIIRPVLQGWTLQDYLNHIEMYRAAGVYLYEHTFGLGTMCCRSSERIVREIIEGIHRRYGYLLGGIHAFGLKITALKDGYIRMALTSADSMAWSLDGRYEQWRNPSEEIFRKANNRLAYALNWRDRVLQTIRSWKYEPVQQLLFI